MRGDAGVPPQPNTMKPDDAWMRQWIYHHIDWLLSMPWEFITYTNADLCNGKSPVNNIRSSKFGNGGIISPHTSLRLLIHALLGLNVLYVSIWWWTLYPINTLSILFNLALLWLRYLLFWNSTTPNLQFCFSGGHICSTGNGIRL